MAKSKTKPTNFSVADFLNSLPSDSQRADARSLVKLLQSATGQKPKMWGPSIIGFGSVHYKYASGREGDMPLVGFSPRKSAHVLYGLQPRDSEPLFSQLGKHTTGKGCVYIKKLAGVDAKVLRSIVLKAAAKSSRPESER